MSVRPYRDIQRRKTKKIRVGKVEVGGNTPISVQSMTNTLTTDLNGTIEQINKISEASADIVRVSCPDQDSSLALKKIIKHINIPIVAAKTAQNAFTTVSLAIKGEIKSKERICKSSFSGVNESNMLTNFSFS